MTLLRWIGGVGWMSMAIVAIAAGGAAGRALASADLPVLNLTGSAFVPKDALGAAEYLVRFEEGVSLGQREALHRKARAVVSRERHLLPGMELIRVQEENVGVYRRSGLVRYVEPNYRARRALPRVEALEPPAEYRRPEPLPDVFPSELFFEARSIVTPNDPYLNNQWPLAPGGVLQAREAWETTTGSASIVVAVVDTGVQSSHEDLAGNMWVNPGEIARNGIDDDRNGYVDDVHGFDMILRRPMVEDFHSHGSHVSGVIGARTNNSAGVAGINWNASILGVRAVPSYGDETDADVIEAFLYAAKNGARVINCSFGKDQSSQAVNDAIRSIADRVLVVAAAGNDGRSIDEIPLYPASFDAENLLVVAATTERGAMAYFSNWGPQSVDIAAPGDHIWSVVRQRYSAMSGTSMASPHVAGAAALVLSRFPHLTPLQLKEVLMESGTPDREMAGRTVSGKMLSLKAALDYAAARYPK